MEKLHAPTCSHARLNDEIGKPADSCDTCNSEPARILLDACDLCSCGSGEDGKLLYECLLWAFQRDEEPKREPFGKKGFYCSPGHELAAKILDKCGLLDHGSGIGWAWLSDKGRELMIWIQENKR